MVFWVKATAGPSTPRRFALNKRISQRPYGAQFFDGWAFPGLRYAPPGAIIHLPSGVNFDAARSFLA
jgi:hypothetical protein